MKAPLIHVASLIFNTPLAIDRDKFEVILSVIGPRLSVDGSKLDQLLQLHAIPSRPAFSAQLDDDDEEDQKAYRLSPEGIAVIPVRGTLLKRNSWMAAASGLCNYAGLRQAATQALADPMSKAVLFDIDSPGGTTHGCFELSDAIYGLRGDKPMWACANDLAASAAYALASATDQIWLTRTGSVGSVGVFALHADQSSMDEQIGVKYTYIAAGDKKTEGNPHEPLSKAARADIQAEVDREYGIFVATVARNRGFAGATQKKIQATEAGVLFADDALPLLADEVGTLEECLGALTQKVNGSRLSGSGKVAISAEAGNNAAEPQPSPNPPAESGEPPKEGVEAMATLETGAAAAEEIARLKAQLAEQGARLNALAGGAAAADKKDPPNDEPDPDDEDDDKKDAKGKKGRLTQMPLAASANDAAVTISTLCQIANAPELAAEYMVQGFSVDKVIAALNARRSKASAENTVNSYVAGNFGGAAPAAGASLSIDGLIEQARVMAANSGVPGKTLKQKQSRCMEQLLRQNPDIYNSYMEEKDRVAEKIKYSGGGRALNEYVLNHQRRYLANLGLGTNMEGLPGRL